jgi:hypothetical protein
MSEGRSKKRNPQRQPEAEFEMRRGGHSEPEVKGETPRITNERTQGKKNYTLLTLSAWPQ